MVTTQTSLFAVSKISLSYTPERKASASPIISSSRCAYDVLYNNWDRGSLEFVEEFKILLLSRANRVLGIVEVSKGGYSATVADPKVIFSSALLGAASGIILAHNHPSGALKPSTADIALTTKVKNAGSLLDLPVLDHIILTAEGYYSFADEGLL